MNTTKISCCTAVRVVLWIAIGMNAFGDQVTKEEPAVVTKTEERLKDRPLTLVKQIRPQYPDAARKDSLAGPVQLEASIDEEGTVEAVKTLSGNPILAEAAAVAVRRWVYESAVVNGKATKSVTVVKLNFKAPEPRP